MQKLQALDYFIFLFYFVVVAGYGYWIYTKKKSQNVSTTDFFLAEGSLTWWAIGASLIASNISAEQFIGMSGNGFSMGLAISTYEWMAAATLLVVGVFFMPIYLKNKIFTMPQFLTQRYNSTVSLIMAIFWLALYILVNLTSILYLGALAVSAISGIDFNICMWGLAIFAIVITIGGMKVIGYTDVIQVLFLIIGGLATTYLAVNLVSDPNNSIADSFMGIINGYKEMTANHGDHFHMILDKGQMMYPNGKGEMQDAFMELPGLAVLFGAMWIVNLNYWGCNQYITQRALGADLKTARHGILFAAFLKILMPIIVTLPGIAAYALYQKGLFQEEMTVNGKLVADKAYPVLLNLLPVGLKGLSFAALTAAIVASLAGKANSISTIFTLDIFKKYLGKDKSEEQLVKIGRWVIVIAMIMAILISPLMGIDKEGGFQFVQQMTGLLSPGIFASFIMGFFWKRTNSAGALFAIVGGFLIAFAMYKNVLPGANWPEVPFINRMGIVFLICVAVMIVLGFVLPDEKKGLEIDVKMFKVDKIFAIGASCILLLLVLIYSYFW
jgi:solute:Na+ symporter, SSS family